MHQKKREKRFYSKKKKGKEKITIMSPPEGAVKHSRPFLIVRIKHQKISKNYIYTHI